MNGMAVLLAGGDGTRLRNQPDAQLNGHALPKQFLPLLSSTHSMLQLTAQRALRLLPPEQVFTITRRRYAAVAAKQLAEVHPALAENLLLEPYRRNTAAAAVSAALYLQPLARNSALALLPCDHAIGNRFAFIHTLKRAMDHVRDDPCILTLGITPDSPSPDYGYILTTTSDHLPYRVRRFMEKPDVATASALISDRACYWNSGIFCTRIDLLLEEANRYCPDILYRCGEALAEAEMTEFGMALGPRPYAELPAEPLDKAVMEKSTRLQLLPLPCGWQDIGTPERLEATRHNRMLETNR